MDDKPLYEKKSLDEWLDGVDYKVLDTYVPSKFALEFWAFIQAVNGSEGESHSTPPVHLKMLDRLAEGGDIVNLCFRGAAKTTLFFEYFAPFLAFKRELPHMKDIGLMIYVSDSMDNGVKSARNNLQYRYENSEFLQQVFPKEHVKFTDQRIEFVRQDGKRFAIKLYGAKTGIRGTKEYGVRPPIAVLDDLVSDDDAKSKANMQSIKDTVYKGIEYAMDPTKRMVVFNGTPFNSEDIMIEAVESGAWNVNVWPVCEKFPCAPEEFRSAWPDRFTYDYVKRMYEKAVLTGKKAAFDQELMLRISSEDSRLIADKEIRFYKKKLLLSARGNFNFYITTDFATSEKQSADYTVLSVWALNSNGDWYWVDGVVAQQTMDKTVNDLFRLAREYQPQSVGIEVTGQQAGFVSWIQSEMHKRNHYFNLASSQTGGQPGIRPQTDKLSRFNMVVPLFKAGKIYWPEEDKDSEILGKYLAQIRLATVHGLKGKDDCIDTISMLAFMNAIPPAGANDFSQAELLDGQPRYTGGSGGRDYWGGAPSGGATISPLSSYMV